ncbi:ABC transporter substrate-binding protein [Pseudonocardia nigra]|uniref:ABC transporter substrate-binding protein n=1 Tax=Pseudonocardia nigra TaxID=1921578 RepID=UPI001C5D73D7|nr:ABC transporter substrate-binding protein [Pseudonocardia nigra]
MSVLQRLVGRARSAPRGTVRVVDPNSLNWLYITYNTVEEAVRVTKRGKIRPAAMSRYRWRDPRTLEITLRRGERFADGSPLDAGSLRRAFDEQVRWVSPHPPGTHFNIDRRTGAEVVDDRTVRLHLPAVDGLALGKLRATHVMTERFWRDLGFGYARDQSGEGHW